MEETLKAMFNYKVRWAAEDLKAKRPQRWGKRCPPEHQMVNLIKKKDGKHPDKTPKIFPQTLAEDPQHMALERLFFQGRIGRYKKARSHSFRGVFRTSSHRWRLSITLSSSHWRFGCGHNAPATPFSGIAENKKGLV